jgi:hypothetical protein
MNWNLQLLYLAFINSCYFYPNNFELFIFIWIWIIFSYPILKFIDLFFVMYQINLKLVIKSSPLYVGFPLKSSIFYILSTYYSPFHNCKNF